MCTECFFDLCEFYNAAIGLVVSIILGWIFTEFIEKWKHKREVAVWKKKFGHLKDETLDWSCYTVLVFQERVNAQISNTQLNSSKASIKYVSENKLTIRLVEKNIGVEREWEGEMFFSTDAFHGDLAYQYTTAGVMAYGTKKVFYRLAKEGNKEYDTFYLMDTDRKTFPDELIKRERRKPNIL